MHVSDNGLVTKSLHASYWGDQYGVYHDQFYFILARFDDGASIALQGDDADRISSDLIAACDAAAENHPGDDQAEINAIDRICEDYEAIEEWSSPAAAGGRPSSDGGLFNFYREAAQ